jgi:hypothetical protein
VLGKASKDDLRLCAPAGSHRTVVPMKTRVAVLAILAAVALVALGASLAGVESATTGTQVAVYNPIAPSGALTSALRVTEHLQGRCSGGGVAGRSSYNCLTTTSRIIDPCFAARLRGPFYCSTNPAVPDVIEVTVRSPAGVTRTEPVERSWAIELEDHQVCIAVVAAIGTRGPFTCIAIAKTPGPVEDCRAPVDVTPYWIAACQARGPQTAPFKTYRVLKVWT